MDSQSSSAQTTAQSDNRNVLGQGALQAQGGSTVVQADNRANYQTDNRANYQTDNRANYQTDNSTSNSTTISYALDGEVANRAILSASDNLGASLDFASGNMTKGYGFGGQALDFASRNMTKGYGFGGQALDFASGAMTKSYGFSGQALAAVIQGENRALDSVAQSNDLVKNAYADAKGRGALTDKITIGAIAMAGLVAFAALKGKA
jgi:hypothetical protein